MPARAVQRNRYRHLASDVWRIRLIQPQPCLRAARHRRCQPPNIGFNAGEDRSVNKWRPEEGCPYPLGATWVEQDRAYNFSVYSRTATSISVQLYAASDLVHPVCSLNFDPYKNKSDDIWHCRITEAQAAGASYYSLHAESSPQATGVGTLFPSGKELLDPYAREIYFPASFQLDSGAGEGGNAGNA